MCNVRLNCALGVCDAVGCTATYSLVSAAVGSVLRLQWLQPLDGAVELCVIYSIFALVVWWFSYAWQRISGSEQIAFCLSIGFGA